MSPADPQVSVGRAERRRSPEDLPGHGALGLPTFSATMLVISADHTDRPLTAHSRRCRRTRLTGRHALDGAGYRPYSMIAAPLSVELKLRSATPSTVCVPPISRKACTVNGDR